MDDIDRAQDHIEKTLALQIAEARSATKQQPGRRDCDNCGELARPGSRFCSRECLEDAEARALYRSRVGLR